MRVLSWLVAVWLVLSAASAQAQARETLAFQGRVKGQLVALQANLYMPSGVTGPIPAMVLVHGSGGPRPPDLDYARQLAALGVATVMADHFGARGVGSSAEDQLSVTIEDMTGDAYGMLQVLAGDARFDPARIGIFGFSKGGSVALDSSIDKVAARFSPNGARFALHVAFYPACIYQYHEARTTAAPVLVLVAGKDRFVGPQPCIDYAGQLKAAGSPVRLVLYPDAGHAWDGLQSHSLPMAQNTARCVGREQADGSWIEMHSGLRTYGPGGVPIPEKIREALMKCATRGVSVQVHTGITAQAKSELEVAVKATFGLR